MRLVIGNKNYSSWSLRAWLYLRESGVDFEEIRVPLFEGDWKEKIRRWSPAARSQVELVLEIWVDSCRRFGGDGWLYAALRGRSRTGRREPPGARVRRRHRQARRRPGRGSRAGWTVAIAAAILVACGPPTSIDLAPQSQPRLAAIDTVFLDAAVARTGDPPQEEDLRREVEARLARGRPSIAPLRDEADALLLFEQADRLACLACAQPEDRWHWWGFVLDPEGRELASFHGELSRASGVPSRAFVKQVRRVLRRSRKLELLDAAPEP